MCSFNKSKILKIEQKNIVFIFGLSIVLFMCTSFQSYSSFLTYFISEKHHYFLPFGKCGAFQNEYSSLDIENGYSVFDLDGNLLYQTFKNTPKGINGFRISSYFDRQITNVNEVIIKYNNSSDIDTFSYDKKHLTKKFDRLAINPSYFENHPIIIRKKAEDEKLKLNHTFSNLLKEKDTITINYIAKDWITSEILVFKKDEKVAISITECKKNIERNYFKELESIEVIQLFEWDSYRNFNNNCNEIEISYTIKYKDQERIIYDNCGEWRGYYDLKCAIFYPESRYR